MKSKKIISFITAAAMLLSTLPCIAYAEDETVSGVYSCDFTQLAAGGAKTEYGTAESVITLDDYTTAYLTYEGTYADTDGKVYLTGGNDGKGAYTNCSYIEFTAPSDGTASFYANAYNYYIDGTYTSYNKSAGTATVDLTAGQKLQVGQRVNGTYISSLTFTPSQSGESTPEPGTTDAPAPGGDIEEYKSPSTLWEFGSSLPSAGKNLPVMGGNAVWANGEVQFPADTTSTGTLTVDMENAIRNNVTVGFDAADHSKALGQQYFNFSIGNSEETIVDFQVHPYSDDYTSVKGLVICGKTVADYADVRAAWGGVGTHHIKTDIDYNAGKVTVTVGTTVITGDIPEGTVSDIKRLEISSTRSKTAADRYISVDNLKIAEFDSTEQPAEVTVTEGYETETIAGFTCRVKAQSSMPAVIYLASELRAGTDTYSQLYDAKPLFDTLDGKATLIAPQTDGLFTDISTLVSTVKETYNASSAIVVGQSKNAAAALSSGADKIITIAGTGSAKPSGKVWVFAGYTDEITPVTDVKAMVNALQTSGVDTLYTEYPYEGHKLNNIVAAEAGLSDWILSDSNKSKTVDLAIFMGQSNMAGRGDYADAVKCIAGHGFEYHSVTEPSVLSTVSEPFGKYENNDAVNDNGGNGTDRRSGDMVSAFMESYYQTSGTPLVGVQCSRGGTESSWWNSNERITEAAARYNEAKKYLEDSGYTIGKQFMVWCQGCADADNNRSIETYKSNTKSIFETMKSNAGLTDMFIVRTGHCKTSGAAEIDEVKDPRYKAINLAQKELADTEENITAVASFYTDEYAALMRDQYHYHQAAYNSVGAIAGNNTAYTLYNTGAWTDYPEPASDIEATPMPVEGVFEITSSAETIDVSTLKMYGNATCRMYKADGSYETVTVDNGRISNTSGGDVTIVPEYKFEFTNQTNPADEYIKGYVKVGENSYTADSGYGLVSGGSYSINENGCRVDEDPIKIDLPKGYYDIEVYRKGGARADIYANGVQIINNTTSSGSQNRPSGSGLMSALGMSLDDGSTYITFGNTSGTNERIASIEIVRVPEKFRKPVIWIAGDSESANYYPINSEGDDLENDKIMMTGFGMQLGKFLSDKYSIVNWGQPSATAGTWSDECLNSAAAHMQQGDTILIDFGINDAVSSSNRVDIETAKTNIKRIVDAAKEKGVTPVFVTPVYNSKYQHKTYFTYSTETETNSIYEFADELGVKCIDLNKYTQLYVNNAKVATGDDNWITNNYHVGDNLHLTQHSALLAASFIAAGVSEMGYETTDYSYTYKDISSIGTDYTRGTETGVTRVYSVSEAKSFMGIKSTETPKPTQTVSPTEEPKYKVTMEYDEKTGTLTAASVDSTITEGTLIKAVYDDDILKSISSQVVTFTANMASADITAEKGMVLYMWNSLEDMQPLSKTYRYSGTGTAEPTAAPTIKPTEIPTQAPSGKVLYEQDFETYSVGDSGGWTSPAGTVSVKSDTADGIGKYMTVVSGKSGTCRSGYVELPTAVTQNFVFECDYKSTSNINVSDLELVENKNSIYANHGVYSNANYVFTMARPKSSDLYVINNKADDSGFSLSSYTDPVFTTKEITGNPWVHVKVVGDMKNQFVLAYVTSLDGKTEYYHGKADMSVGRDSDITSWKCIHLLSPSTNCDTCIDNIKITEATDADLAASYHKVTLTCKSYTFNQYVLDGESAVNIPDVSKYGEYFEGWTVGDDTTKYTSAQLASVPITEDCEIVGHISADYIEAIENVEFKDFPAGGELVMGTDENTYGSNKISLAITGEQGTSLVTNPDSRVTDYNVEWTFDGFRTLDGAPTGETGNKYCDSYALLETTDTVHNTAVDFALKRTAANYYGRVTAKVTYNGKTIEVSKPLVLLGDKSSTALLPKAGYTADYNKYEDTMVGYRFEQNDIVLGGWQTAGSDASYVDLKSDSTGKYLALSRAASGNSSYIYNEIGDITTQTVFEQDVRFGIDGNITYIGGSITSPSSTAFGFGKSGSNLTFNGTTLCAGESGKWYHVVICADPTSKKCFAKVYELKSDGDYSKAAPIAKSETVDFAGAYTSGAAYCVTPTKSKTASIDLNNIRIYCAGVDEETISVTAPETKNIPESGSETANITVTAKTTDGSDAIGKAQWSIDDEFAEGVSIESTGDNSAILIIESTASSGDLPIRVAIGGKSEVITIKLIGTKDNIAFKSAPTGVQTGTSATYTAVLRDGNGNDKTAAITYTLYNADNTAAVTPDGISLDSQTGVLNVSETAAAQIIGIRAISGDISKFVRVNIYNLKFAFGTDTVADGYTPVNISTAYSANRGYGIDGTATEGADNGTLSNLTFKVNLEKGKVYRVTAKYKGKIVCEKISSSLTGFERSMSTLESDTYDVAVFGDDIMDITIPSDSEISSIEITSVAKTATAKPDWWTIGDSTVQQNGSWGYTIAATETTDLSKYPELAEVVNGFHNSGKAGEQHKNFYSNGRLNSILIQMNPGDVVSISGMGTNDSSSTFEEFKAYDEVYMNAIIDMGGYVILGSYTPTGNYGATQGKVYDADTMTFKGMRTNSYDRAIRELYEENKDNPKVLGFLDIGKMADEKMTANVKAVYDAAIENGADEAAARSVANAKAEEMMAWWKDYNHYYTTFSNYILPSITEETAKMIKAIKE